MEKAGGLTFWSAWSLWSFLIGALWVYPAMLLHYALALSDWTPLPAETARLITPSLSVAAGAIFLAFMIRSAIKRFSASSPIVVTAIALAAGLGFIALGLAAALKLGLGSMRPLSF
ncbi:hypothetical protein ABAC460_14905 [Asticcacaulis sp. AC460]|uniref:hypothetical protein n=1 Tax=Asticcacaulis sp. AC460 TaxID=1282360 RepID=UPI0003C3F22C|nr:hypothetical protein [Asticcacaulis sp. AC460]ESQ88737.1 hypothetical protein ABAC460_14905 [Asticcacaulis sp. AC460]